MTPTQAVEVRSEAPPPPAVAMPNLAIITAGNQIGAANRAYCDSDETAGKCVELDAMLQQTTKRINDEHRVKTEGILATKTAIDLEKRTITASLDSARKHVQGLLIDYRKQKDAEAAAAAKGEQQLQEDATLAEAQKLEAEGKHQEAQQVLEDGADLANSAGVAVQTGPIRGETGGTASIGKSWDFDIEDVTKIPRKYCRPDPILIREAVLAKKNPVRKIPGVRIFQIYTFRNR